MRTIDIIEKLERGSLFYECESGMNIEAVTLGAPDVTEENGKRRFSWEARNTKTGEEISYLWNEAYSAYGPKLYTDPQYVRISEGQAVFQVLGGDGVPCKEAHAPSREDLVSWLNIIDLRGEPIGFDTLLKEIEDPAKLHAVGGYDRDAIRQKENPILSISDQDEPSLGM